MVDELVTNGKTDIHRQRVTVDEMWTYLRRVRGQTSEASVKKWDNDN